jgi:hypothetical protein
VPPYKLIESSTGKAELFDLDGDPAELINLVPLEPDTVSRLSEQLAEVVRTHPPLYDPGSRADLRDDTAEALKALGYLD